MKNNGISPASPTVLPAAERREDERSETDRSSAAGKTVAPPPAAPPRPNPEVVADAKRRTFTAEYKLAHPGGGRCRRRSARRHRRLAAARGPVLLAPGHLAARAAGRHPQGLDPAQARPQVQTQSASRKKIQKLRRENQRLTEQLRKAEIVIDVQKKVGALLGWPLPKADPEEKP